MKKIISGLLNVLPAVYAVFFFSACSKQEDLPGKAYGKIGVNATFSGTAMPVLIQVDGVIKDTLSMQRQSITSGIIAEAGARTYSLLKLDDKTSLFETTLTIEAGKTIQAPKFLYDGVATLFDDQTTNPEKDSMLVRFINQVPAFPEVIDLQIKANISGETTAIPVKSVKGVTKKTFSNFVQLPDLTKILQIPSGKTARYIIEATDPGNNNTVLLSLQTGKYTSIVGVGGGSFTANGVLSIGILPPSRGNLYLIRNIFERVNQ